METLRVAVEEDTLHLNNCSGFFSRVAVVVVVLASSFNNLVWRWCAAVVSEIYVHDYDLLSDRYASEICAPH